MTSGALQNPQESRGGSPVEAPRSGIVWLASFPKSGNTWTRAFLHNLVHVTSGEAAAQRINELNQFSSTSAAKFLFEEVLGFSPTEKHLEQIAAARGRAQQYIADLVEGLIFVKTHRRWRLTAATPRSIFPSPRERSTSSAIRSMWPFPTPII
jgi:hypothetical protein